MPDRANVEKGGIRGGVNQDVQVAVFGVVAAEDRTEDASITGTVGFHYAPDFLSVGSQCF